MARLVPVTHVFLDSKQDVEPGTSTGMTRMRN